MPVDLNLYAPGKGYRVKEYIAAGTWKMAFRGSAPESLNDVALLCYHEAEPANYAEDASRLLRLHPNLRFREYLPAFFSVFYGEDSRLWLVEELLVRPLSALSPQRDMVKSVKIARDLCRGLICLHREGLVHRDIKLENCGIDRYGRAKIFDLGSLVSGPADSPCTILTRPPEVLRAESDGHAGEFDKRCDIWALGATLFALRTGKYPFASEQDVATRNGNNGLFAAGQISKAELNRRKEGLDEAVRSRAASARAEPHLLQEVADSFGGREEEIIRSMLAFDPDDRPEVEVAEANWSKLADALAGATTLSEGGSERAWASIEAVLGGVVRGELSVSRRHIERVIAEWDEQRSKVAREEAVRVNALIEKAKVTVELQMSERLAR